MRRIREFAVEIDQEPDPYWAMKDLYEPRADLTGWRSIVQKVAVWALGKLNARPQMKPVHYVRHLTPIEDPKGDIANYLSKRSRKFLESVVHGRAKTVLIGPKEYAELMNGKAGSDNWVALDLNLKIGTRDTGVRVYGMDLHVIPHMEGVLVLPGKIETDGRYID